MGDTKLDDAPARDSIVIIGIAGRFPGARDIEERWQNLDTVGPYAAYVALRRHHRPRGRRARVIENAPRPRGVVIS